MTPKHEDAWLQFADRGFGLKTNLPLCQHYYAGNSAALAHYHLVLSNSGGGGVEPYA